jgi:hypothetical protein
VIPVLQLAVDQQRFENPQSGSHRHESLPEVHESLVDQRLRHPRLDEPGPKVLHVVAVEGQFPDVVRVKEPDQFLRDVFVLD